MARTNSPPRGSSLPVLGLLLCALVLCPLGGCGKTDAKQASPAGHRALVLEFEGVGEASDQRDAIHGALNSYAGFDTVAWRDGRLHCFLVNDASEARVVAETERRVQGKWKIKSKQVDRNATRFGTSSGTKSGGY